MLQNVSDTLDIKTHWLGSSLDIAYYVIVERLRDLRLEQHLNLSLSLGVNYSTHRLDSKGVAPLHFSFDRLLIERVSQRHILQVLQVNDLFVLTTNQQRPEVNFSCIKEHVRLDDLTNNEEMLGYFLSRNLKNPVTSVTSNKVWSVLKNHVGLLTAENGALGCCTSEKSRVRVLLGLDLFPLEIIG
jgi:hypothetical protein